MTMAYSTIQIHEQKYKIYTMNEYLTPKNSIETLQSLNYNIELIRTQGAINRARSASSEPHGDAFGMKNMSTRRSCSRLCNLVQTYTAIFIFIFVFHPLETRITDLSYLNPKSQQLCLNFGQFPETLLYSLNQWHMEIPINPQTTNFFINNTSDCAGISFPYINP